MKKTALTLATDLVLSVCATPAVGQKYEPNWKSLDSRPIPGQGRRI
ncbi:MAG: hypothetical protein KBH45_07295 [Verrucomicrobia bacterium]|nr:hypothetical protein [Verrucomicrobiota bacterium]